MSNAPRTLTRDEVREIDRRAVEEYGLPGIVLMENAGRGCAELLRASGPSGLVTICCGRGNNGGDGFVIARHLENTGRDVRVLLFADPSDVSGDAAVNLRVLQSAGTPLQCFPNDPDRGDLEPLLAESEGIVDALLGTGVRGEVRQPFAMIIESINAAGKSVFAVDLPSGLDCDDGTPLGPCVRAAQTATFVGLKRGFTNPAAKQYTGEVHVVDIGVPRVLVDIAAATETMTG